ncbi:hypothetical protein [Streptomyces sp. NBC_00046]|uniref:hypothetical protein n=1 Tax=Streptomyces sp. NBC_00046 TaxID=2975626 RepID=UPI00324BFAEF
MRGAHPAHHSGPGHRTPPPAPGTARPAARFTGSPIRRALGGQLLQGVVREPVLAAAPFGFCDDAKKKGERP